MNIEELFFKVIENPRCIKYYEDLINYYESKKQEKKAKIYKILINKIKNDNNMSSN